jgi:hypothetical protein
VICPIPSFTRWESKSSYDGSVATGASSFSPFAGAVIAGIGTVASNVASSRACSRSAKPTAAIGKQSTEDWIIGIGSELIVVVYLSAALRIKVLNRQSFVQGYRGPNSFQCFESNPGQLFAANAEQAAGGLKSFNQFR